MTPQEITNLKEGDIVFQSNWRGDKFVHYITHANRDNTLFNTIALGRSDNYKKRWSLIFSRSLFIVSMSCSIWVTFFKHLLSLVMI